MLLLGILYLHVSPALGQQVLVIEDGGRQVVRGKWDSLAVQSALQQQLWEHLLDGYVFAAWDTLAQSSDSLVVRLHKGTRYAMEQAPLNKRARKKMLQPFIDRGYPFATVVLDSVATKGDTLAVNYRVDRGPEIVFDSISLRNPVKLTDAFLYRTLDFQVGDPYSEKVFANSRVRIGRLKQVEMMADPDVAFESGLATVFLNLKDRKSDSFEGILGLLNDQNQGATLTGYLNLHLNNLFGSGKELHIDWNRFAAESQDLDLSYVHPYLLRSEFELRAALAIFKQDSSFVKRDFAIGMQFPIGSDLLLGASFGQHVSDLLGDEPNINQGLDYTNTAYKAAARWKADPEALDGYRDALGMSASIEIGDKQIRENAQVPTEVYDTLQLRSTNYQLDFVVSGQWTFGKKSALFGRALAGSVEGPEVLRNEYYRVGGLRSFRGYNENEIFARWMAVVQSEYRLYFEERSYLLALIDLGMVDSMDGSDFIRGYGAGLSIETEAGDFQLIFALGDSEEIPADIRNVKAHFGYSITF